MSDPHRRVKDPDAKVDFAINLESRLVDGETVTGVTFLASDPAGLVIEDSGFDANTVWAFFSGGVDGQEYKVTARFTTSKSGITDDVSFCLLVQDSASVCLPTPEPSSIQDAIERVAQGPAQSRAGEESVVEHNLKDLIAADKYLASKQAAKARRGGLRVMRGSAPNAMGGRR